MVAGEPAVEQMPVRRPESEKDLVEQVLRVLGDGRPLLDDRVQGRGDRGPGRREGHGLIVPVEPFGPMRGV
jgi:hypothetical protein